MSLGQVVNRRALMKKVLKIKKVTNIKSGALLSVIVNSVTP